ncbi:PREDICTED: uncharacterized protein LOC109155176 [Ipomoea nil]|uniref:uncharacterized protein LOC109155176 n=1 Tax=Ipomoea nil TaxID=35883 RepID=UPI000901BD08|nr:PREDICTED: uncharacterized protein LOC109155176 [Ipomoea nil]
MNDPELNMTDPELTKEHEEQCEIVSYDWDEINFSDDAFVVESDSDGESKWPVFREATDMNDPEFTLGMTFASKKQFREAVQNSGFKNGKDIRTIRNDALRVIVECSQDGCSWVWENSMVKAAVVAKRWAKQLNNNPEWMMKKFRDTVTNEEGFYLSDQQAHRAMWKAKKQRIGDAEDNFKKIWSYCAEIDRTNSRTRYFVKLSDLQDGETGQERFLRIGSGGMLLTAVGVDANDSLFPLAYAIVEGEKRESWSWFLKFLAEDLGITKDTEQDYTFISDKQKGLMPAFEEIIPGVEHRFCVRHLHSNMKVAGFQGKALKDALWECARATTLNSYTSALHKLRALDEEACQWLGDKSPTEWSRSHFSSHTHCDMLVNNICESLNAALLGARDQPIIDCLECDTP